MYFLVINFLIDNAFSSFQIQDIENQNNNNNNSPTRPMWYSVGARHYSKHFYCVKLIWSKRGYRDCIPLLRTVELNQDRYTSTLSWCYLFWKAFLWIRLSFLNRIPMLSLQSKIFFLSLHVLLLSLILSLRHKLPQGRYLVLHFYSNTKVSIVTGTL